MSLHHVKRPWTPKLIGGGRDLRGRRVWRSRRAMSAPRRRARRARAPATGAAPTQPESAPDLRTRPEARLTAGQSAAPSCRTHRRSRQRRNARGHLACLPTRVRRPSPRAGGRAGGRPYLTPLRPAKVSALVETAPRGLLALAGACDTGRLSPGIVPRDSLADRWSAGSDCSKSRRAAASVRRESPALERAAARGDLVFVAEASRRSGSR
jgi:hypothetical protein